MFLIDRGFGLIRYASIGWPASNNDIYILKSCRLFHNRQKRSHFLDVYGPIVGDKGFFDKDVQGIIIPNGNEYASRGRGGRSKVKKRKRHKRIPLTLSEKRWSQRVSAVEIGIENTFAAIFHNKYTLVKRGPQPMCKNAAITHPRIILAAAILYNIEIIYNRRPIFDGPNL